MISGKRELLACGLYWSGILRCLRLAPAKSTLLVLNYHRIGDARKDLFDPGVFSATSEEFDEQVSFLKRRTSIVGLEEAEEFVAGHLRDTRPQCRVLITFDDGYLDNYQLAFPVLRTHGVQGVFFLATGMVGSCYVPWWDHIAFVMRTARRRRFTLPYPAELTVDLEADGLTDSLREVLNLYKRPQNTSPDRFLEELQNAAGGDEVPHALRRFLSWDEAREMIAGGMAIGSHTDSHTILSQLDTVRQCHELEYSRRVLTQTLGVPITSLAYPVGARNSFTEETQQLAGQAGYRIAFSFHGGTNTPQATKQFDVKRVGVGDQSKARFRVQAEVCRFSGRYWP